MLQAVLMLSVSFPLSSSVGYCCLSPHPPPSVTSTRGVACPAIDTENLETSLPRRRPYTAKRTRRLVVIHVSIPYVKKVDDALAHAPQGAGPPSGWTMFLGPSLLTNPFLRLKRCSISSSRAPRSRMTSTSRIMPEVRNLLPWPPDRPRLSNSSSASRDSLSRASSAERTGLLDGDGNMGPPVPLPPLPYGSCGDDVVGDAVDEGEYVGLGWTTPICRSRSARPGWRLLSGGDDMCGSEPSRRMAGSRSHR